MSTTESDGRSQTAATGTAATGTTIIGELKERITLAMRASPQFIMPFLDGDSERERLLHHLGAQFGLATRTVVPDAKDRKLRYGCVMMEMKPNQELTLSLL